MGVSEFLTKVVRVFLFLGKLFGWYLDALYRRIIPPPMKSIDGETILVTGAVGGIGKEICRHLARNGSNMKLVLWDLDQNELDKLSLELKITGKNKGLQVYPLAVDISTRENVDSCAERVKSEAGPISIIINNAGIAPTGNFLHMESDTIEKVIQVNLMSHFWIIRQFLPGMLSKNHGRIVNICSAGALKPAALSFPYFASKYAVNGYTETLAIELNLFDYDGIHVSTVYPWYVRTPLVRSLEINKPKGVPIMIPSPFTNFVKPDYVAGQIVDGMRREYEYIYCPSSVRLMALIDYIFPLKFRKLLLSTHIKSYSFGEEKDRKEMEQYMSYKLQN